MVAGLLFAARYLHSHYLVANLTSTCTCAALRMFIDLVPSETCPPSHERGGARACNKPYALFPLWVQTHSICHKNGKTFLLPDTEAQSELAPNNLDSIKRASSAAPFIFFLFSPSSVVVYYTYSKLQRGSIKYGLLRVIRWLRPAWVFFRSRPWRVKASLFFPITLWLC